MAQVPQTKCLLGSHLNIHTVRHYCNRFAVISAAIAEWNSATISAVGQQLPRTVLKATHRREEYCMLSGAGRGVRHPTCSMV